ncbi:MAG: AI-2E family transporter [Candidatus Omnitrophota bacterium]
MNREQLISYFFIGFLLFIVLQVFYIFSPFFKAIFWAMVLTFTFYPLLAFFKEKLRMPETIAALLLTVIVFLVVIPPVVILVINVTQQAIDLYQLALDYFRSGKFQILIDNLRAAPFIQRMEARFVEWDMLKNSAESWVLNSLKALGQHAASSVGELTKNLFVAVVNLFFMAFLVFVFLKDGHRIVRFLYEVAPFEEKSKKLIFGHINESLSAVIRGQLFTSFMQGLLAGTIYALLGIPAPVLLGVATFIGSLLPVIGASGIWVPIVVYLFFQGAMAKALILLLAGIFGISIMDNILKPYLIGEKTKLSYFLLFFAILGGLKLYGLVGMFLAPVVLSLFFALIKIYQEQYRMH